MTRGYALGRGDLGSDVAAAHPPAPCRTPCVDSTAPAPLTNRCRLPGTSGQEGHMSSFCSLHRFPRAGIDRIDPELARSMLALVMTEPQQCETIVLLLDHERRGLGVLVVSGTGAFDSIFDVLDAITSRELDRL